MAPNSNRRLTLFDVARAVDELPSLPDDLRGPLKAEATFTGRIPAYPTGAAVCEAEVDPETGTIEVRRIAIAGVLIDEAAAALSSRLGIGRLRTSDR